MPVQSKQVYSGPTPSPLSLLSKVLSNPLFTGPLLLYALLRPGSFEPPSWYRPYTLSIPLPFTDYRPSLTTNATHPVTTLKWLFGIGLFKHFNLLLSRLAYNNWKFAKEGEPWRFNDEGAETILITGGCSGFGRQMVFQFSQRSKAKLVVIDVNDLPEDMKDVPRLTFHKCDITDDAALTALTKKILVESPPTVLINNAGIASAHTLLSTTPAYLEKVFRVNVFSHFTLIRLILPRMLRQRKGHIVTIASMASYTGQASLGDYTATKGAVLCMHESLVQELAHRFGPRGGHAIQASVVHPMWANTNIVSSWKNELAASGQPVLSPEEVAWRVVNQVLAGRSGSVFVPERMWQGTLMRAVPDWLALGARASIQIATMTDSTEAADVVD